MPLLLVKYTCNGVRCFLTSLAIVDGSLCKALPISFNERPANKACSMYTLSERERCLPFFVELLNVTSFLRTDNMINQLYERESLCKSNVHFIGF